jgi:membrane-associated protease RseP (regulator of RpoE activity)
MTQNRVWHRLGWWLAPVAIVSLAGWARGADGEKETPATAPAEAAAKKAESAAAYWLGILGTPADALLKTHLKLDAGVVVEHVVPESPAAKAGIRENDILLKFGEVKLTDVESLMKTVAENKDREAKLTLLREGKQTVVTVKPAQRPIGIAIPAVPGAGDWGQITDWMMKRLERGEVGDDPLRMFFVHPGVVVPKELKERRFELFTGPSATVQLPKNTSITITRQQEGPAKIIVQQGEQKWEVTDKELDKLPEDVRPAVKSMLGGNARVYVFGQGQVVMPGIPPQGPAEGAAPKAKAEPEKKRDPAASDLGKVREKLEEMNRQLRENEKKMQRQLDELRQQLEKVKQQQI